MRFPIKLPWNLKYVNIINVDAVTNKLLRISSGHLYEREARHKRQASALLDLLTAWRNMSYMMTRSSRRFDFH